MKQTTVIRAEGLRKAYCGRPALRGIGFAAAQGEFMALLGPNGAGKSTLMRILCTELRPDAGRVWLDGLEFGARKRTVRSRLGAVFQTGVLDEALTVEENLCVRASLYGLRGERLQGRLKTVCRDTKTEAMLPRLYGQLSGGQKRRCDIARALLPDPAVLLLDEPCTGLDAAARSAVWDAVARIRREERTTILLSTHDMDEAGRADSVLILNEGKIAAAGTPAELRSAFARDSLVLFSNDFARLAGNLAAAGIPYRTEKGGARIVLRESLGALPILEWCRGSYTGFEVRRGTLETAYLTVLEGDGGHADVCAALYRTVCSGQGRGVPVLSD